MFFLYYIDVIVQILLLFKITSESESIPSNFRRLPCTGQDVRWPTVGWRHFLKNISPYQLANLRLISLGDGMWRTFCAAMPLICFTLWEK